LRMQSNVSKTSQLVEKVGVGSVVLSKRYRNTPKTPQNGLLRDSNRG
jgi:hypothetical protein